MWVLLQHTCSNVMPDAYSEYPQSDTKVRRFETGANRVLDCFEENRVISSEQFVVDIHGDDDNQLPMLENKDTMISMCSVETKLDKEVMKSGIPLLSCLLQPVQSFPQLGHLHLTPLFLITHQLLHVNILGYHAIQVHGLDIELVNHPPMLHTDSKKNTESCRFHNWGESLQVINTLPLAKPLHYQSCFESHNFSISTTFLLEYKVTTNNILDIGRCRSTHISQLKQADNNNGQQLYNN